MNFDTRFNFKSDARERDPDQHSPTLRRYHRFLWSKQLPDGRPFELVDTRRGHYLHHASDAGEFSLASDSVMQTFTRWAVAQPVIAKVAPAEVERFEEITYTIGGMMVFPANRVDGKPTLNVARGFNRKISDRMDLTLECIRRHYRGAASPLATTLQRYREFFALFGDFRGYVEFFLLEDLVTRDGAAVEFFTPFDDFKTPAVPRDAETYSGFMRASVAFVEARNRRMLAWSEGRTATGVDAT